MGRPAAAYGPVEPGPAAPGCCVGAPRLDGLARISFRCYGYRAPDQEAPRDPPALPPQDASHSLPDELRPSGFWVRGGALLIDSAVTLILGLAGIIPAMMVGAPSLAGPVI